MLMVKLNKWSEIDNTRHISTTWTVYADANKTQIVDGPYVKSANMVDMLVSDVNIPVGTTYYVSAIRHFNKSDMDYEVPLIEVTSKAESFSNMLLPEDTIIEQPYTYVEGYNGLEAKAFKNFSTITLKTSKFRSNNDIHKATHYFIYDQNDNILFSQIDAMDNSKYKVSVNVTTEMKLASKLKLVTIHKGATGLESRAGTLIVDMKTRELTFEITTNLNNVEPLVDLEVNFKQANSKVPMNILKINLVKTSSKEILQTLTFVNNKVVIPWEYLQDGNNVSLEIEIPDEDGVSSDYIYRDITILTTEGYPEIDSDFTYENKFKEVRNEELRLPNKVISKSLYNGYILFPSNEDDNKDLNSYTFGDTGLVFRKASGITIPSEKDYINILPISKNRVVIDMLNENYTPTFYIYQYSIINDTFKLETSVSRDDETICLGKTNNIVQISSTELLYIPVNSNKLKKLNVITGDITPITRTTVDNVTHDDIPLENLTHAVILKCNANRVLIGNSIDNTALCYNYAKNEYEDGFTYGLDTHINKESISTMLKNGNALIYDTTTADNYDNPFISFDINKMNFSPVTFSFELIKPTSIIFTSDYKIVFTNYRSSLEFGNHQRYFIYY